MITIIIFSVIGVLLSVYSIYVSEKSKNRNYHAVCDISDNVSCSKAFGSKYGKTFGVSNSVWGIIFYLTLIVLGFFGFANYIFYLAILSFLGSLYLAYVLYFKLKDWCIVCTGVYMLNALILIFSYLAI